MPFYRFEGMKSHRFNPHLSTADGPVIEGEFERLDERPRKGGDTPDAR